MQNNNKKRKHAGGEEEEEFLLTTTCKVVEYLHPPMAKELLVKFPDNSAFDFNYSESSIWSPLVPRIHNFGGGFLPALDFGDDCRAEESGRRKKRKKMAAAAAEVEEGGSASCSFRLGGGSREENGGTASTTAAVSCVPLASKGWNKVMKAATKHFKKKKKKEVMKRRASHVRLCNYLGREPAGRNY